MSSVGQNFEEPLNFYNFLQNVGWKIFSLIYYSKLRKEKMKEINIVSTIQFGDYNWCILDIKNNAALIITENIIEQRVFMMLMDI